MNKRRPLWPVLTATLVLLPLVYIGSLGVACWLHASHLMPEPVRAAVATVYYPIAWLMESEHSPEWLRYLLNEYVAFWYS